MGFLVISTAIFRMGRWGQTLIRSVQGNSEKIHFTKGISGTGSWIAGQMRHCTAVDFGGRLYLLEHHLIPTNDFQTAFTMVNLKHHCAFDFCYSLRFL